MIVLPDAASNVTVKFVIAAFSSAEVLSPIEIAGGKSSSVIISET